MRMRTCMFVLNSLRCRTQWTFVDFGNLASNFPCLLESQAPISGKIPHYELSWKEGNSQSLPLMIEAESQIFLLFTL